MKHFGPRSAQYPLIIVRYKNYLTVFNPVKSTVVLSLKYNLATPEEITTQSN